MVVVLPAPFGLEQPEDFALRDIEVDAIDDGRLAVALGQTAGPQ